MCYHFSVLRFSCLSHASFPLTTFLLSVWHTTASYLACRSAISHSTNNHRGERFLRKVQVSLGFNGILTEETRVIVKLVAKLVTLVPKGVSWSRQSKNINDKKSCNSTHPFDPRALARDVKFL